MLSSRTDTELNYLGLGLNELALLLPAGWCGAVVVVVVASVDRIDTHLLLLLCVGREIWRQFYRYR